MINPWVQLWWVHYGPYTLQDLIGMFNSSISSSNSPMATSALRVNYLSQTFTALYFLSCYLLLYHCHWIFPLPLLNIPACESCMPYPFIKNVKTAPTLNSTDRALITTVKCKGLTKDPWWGPYLKLLTEPTYHSPCATGIIVHGLFKTHDQTSS